MDQNTVETICVPHRRDEIPRWRPGDAFLAGGTWLYSESQTDARRLVDLTGFRWAPLATTNSGLEIAATCTIAQLARAECRVDWSAAPLIRQCCRALLGSFKVWNVATVGGNLCMALPAGPLIALACALDGLCTIWTPDGDERQIAATDFVLGSQQTDLRPGELLRSIALPVAALRRRAAFRQISLNPQGRSGALVIGTATASNLFITVTAAVPRPVCIRLPLTVSAQAMRDALNTAIAPPGWYDDVHGRPDWRAHVTALLAEEVRAELTAAHRT